MSELQDKLCYEKIQNSNMLVPWILMSAYAYYFLNSSLISDGLYDNLTKLFVTNFDNIKHRHKYLINKKILKSKSSLFYLKENQYPSIVKNATKTLLGEKEMPKKQAKTEQSLQLIEALQFVSCAATKKENPYQSYVMLNNGWAIMTDGQLTAGFTISEALECCPKISLLQTAISKCNANENNPLSITELDNGSLSIKGEKLRAIVPCVSFDIMPGPPLMTPDENIAPITDEIKKAFSVCGTLVSESGNSFIEASLLLEANTCTSTNRQVLIQCWHGIDLPPNLLVPKIFAQAVCKEKKSLTGFGYTENRSVTFWFGNNAWIKTQLYEDKYPNIAPIIERPSSPSPVGKDFFEAIEIVGSFSEDKRIYFQNGKIVSYLDENKGAQYEENINKSLSRCYSTECLKLIAPFATEIDFTTYKDRAMFFGENLRGTVMACEMPEDDIPF